MKSSKSIALHLPRTVLSENSDIGDLNVESKLDVSGGDAPDGGGTAAKVGKVSPSVLGETVILSKNDHAQLYAEIPGGRRNLRVELLSDDSVIETRTARGASRYRTLSRRLDPRWSSVSKIRTWDNDTNELIRTVTLVDSRDAAQTEPSCPHLVKSVNLVTDAMSRGGASSVVSAGIADAFATVLWRDEFETEDWMKLKYIVTYSGSGEVLHIYAPPTEPLDDTKQRDFELEKGIVAVSGELWRPRDIVINWYFSGPLKAKPSWDRTVYLENGVVDNDGRANVVACGTGYKFSIAKHQFAMDSIQKLGRTQSAGGFKVGEKMILKMSEFAKLSPPTVPIMEAALNVSGWEGVRKYIYGHCEISARLRPFVLKRGSVGHRDIRSWSDEDQKVWVALCSGIDENLQISPVDYENLSHFNMYIDSSKFGFTVGFFGAYVFEVADTDTNTEAKGSKPIKYEFKLHEIIKRVWSGGEGNWSAKRRELRAMVIGVMELKHLWFGYVTIIIHDH